MGCPRPSNGSGTLVLGALLILAPAATQAQTSDGDLPQINVEARAKKPAAAKPRRLAPTRPNRPVVVVNPQPGGEAASASTGTPPIKQTYQLPQTAASVTAAEIEQKINVVDSEDAVKYMPSLFVRKRNNGDTQPVLATRTWGVNSSARNLVYVDDILISALIGNNNTIGAPRWGLVAPEEIKRVDFLYGPFAAAYPGNSMGGVLLITTRMPDKLEMTAKQVESLQTFDRYKTSGTYRTDQTSVTLGDRNGNFSYFISGNFQNSYSQPLSWVTTTNTPAGTSGTIPQLNKTGSVANVVGAGGLLHTEMANLKGKFAWDITPLVQAVYSIGYWSNDADSRVESYLRNAAGLTTFGGVSGFAGGNYTLNEQHLANSLSVKSDTKGTFDFDLSASRYDWLEDIQRNPYTVVAGSAAAAFSKNGKIARLDGTNWMNGDAKGIWRPNDAHEISFGLHADRYFLNNPTYATPTWNSGPDSTSALYTNGRGATRTAALWLQDAWTFAPALKLTLGGRLEDWKAYDGYNLQTAQSAAGAILSTSAKLQPELDATRFSPKASLAYEPSKEWLATASFGQAYRFPTVSELYQIVSSGTNLQFPNPNLTPENVLSEELALERRFKDGKLRLSLFHEYVRDALISQTGVVPGSTTLFTFFSNVDAIRNRGIELAAQKDNFLIDRLEAFGSVTYVDSRIVSDPDFVSATGTTATGKRVPYVPDWRATLGATYRPDAYWALTAAMRYSGKQFSTLDNTDIISNVYGAFDSFTVVDLRAQYKFSETATANFGVDNVGNAKYTLFHPFPGRTYVADVKIKF
ncbi:iron complex outermembrane receptor protein [Rhodopseudomonas rhenobacensis]|uniref:Iron complex outermembrane receptor protein n=1 Tax=Rhodopseudomonas rhenobacensis TaxID=87461 RepID=A0A7W7Z1L8_9BRAD|nr:TonB-dependent receptor [Rhodopseudomonas rhenobacensis]MBB5046358.1 iron complex outermembrane receptor protein [Rhodopseudomonas rhenobacensis]